MNPFAYALRRPFSAMLLVTGVVSGGLLAQNKEGVAAIKTLDAAKLQAAVDSSKLHAVLDYLGLGEKSESESEGEGEKGHGHGEGHHKIVVSTPKSENVVLTQDFVCQIHSQRHINVCALENGYLQEIAVREGQAVKKGDVMFRILPVLYKARLDAELAEARLAQLEYNNTRRLAEGNLPVVSQNEVSLLEAKLAKAQAKAQLAAAEFDFTTVRAPFDGIVDRLQEQLGSLIKEGDVLTTLSDNSVMWVYFNVPEKRYLEYMADVSKNKADQSVDLLLATGEKFEQPGRIAAIEAKFNNETGNIPFRADFPNPNRLLRHGQTGTVQIRRVAENAVVIPQRATFEVLDKKYVYVVGPDDVVRQREIVTENELDDIYVVKKGVTVKDKIVLEGVREVRDGEKVAYEFRRPEVVIAQLKNRAE